jgi:hypothetical protein
MAGGCCEGAETPAPREIESRKTWLHDCGFIIEAVGKVESASVSCGRRVSVNVECCCLGDGLSVSDKTNGQTRLARETRGTSDELVL